MPQEESLNMDKRQRKMASNWSKYLLGRVQQTGDDTLSPLFENDISVVMCRRKWGVDFECHTIHVTDFSPWFRFQ